jgi:acyl-CoA thioesterase-2
MQWGEMNEIKGPVVPEGADHVDPDTLGELLTPMALDDDRFRLRNVSGGWARLFGGQVVAQALAAGAATVPSDRLVNSLHAYFLRGGVRERPIECMVERERDGANFSNRRVVASQDGKSILSMIASWHTGERGPDRNEIVMPADAGRPEDFPSYQEIPSEAVALEPGSPFDVLEVRPVVGGLMAPTERVNVPARTLLWMRFRDTHDADEAMARLMIAYASDLLLIGTAFQSHREQVSQRPVIASVDHTVRFHASPDVSDWMLCLQRSEWAGEGRALIRSVLFRRDGTPIASISQEGLLRL